MNSTCSTVHAAFGRRLREVRRAQGMSQDQLADRTGMHATAIGRMERGYREPRVSTVLRLADGLGVPPGALLDGLAWRAQLPTDGEG